MDKGKDNLVVRVLMELGDYAKQYDDRVYPPDSGAQTIGVPLRLLRSAQELSADFDVETFEERLNRLGLTWEALENGEVFNIYKDRTLIGRIELTRSKHNYTWAVVAHGFDIGGHATTVSKAMTMVEYSYEAAEASKNKPRGGVTQGWKQQIIEDCAEVCETMASREADWANSERVGGHHDAAAQHDFAEAKLSSAADNIRSLING